MFIADTLHDPGADKIRIDCVACDMKKKNPKQKKKNQKQKTNKTKSSYERSRPVLIKESTTGLAECIRKIS